MASRIVAPVPIRNAAPQPIHQAQAELREQIGLFRRAAIPQGRRPVVLHDAFTVFIEHAQIKQRADMGGKTVRRALVEINRILVVTAAVVLQRQPKQSTCVIGAVFHSTLIQGYHFTRPLPAQGFMEYLEARA